MQIYVLKAQLNTWLLQNSCSCQNFSQWAVACISVIYLCPMSIPILTMHRCVCICDGGWFTTCVVSQSLLLTVNATKMAKLRPVFTWRWWKVTPGWIELVLGKQRFWSLKPTGALQTMLMYKASYQSCSCSHLLTLIYKQQVSLQFFFISHRLRTDNILF